MEDTLKFYVRGGMAVIFALILLCASYNLGARNVNVDIINTCQNDGVIKIMSNVFKCERFNYNEYGK